MSGPRLEWDMHVPYAKCLIWREVLSVGTPGYKNPKNSAKHDVERVVTGIHDTRACDESSAKCGHRDYEGSPNFTLCIQNV